MNPAQLEGDLNEWGEGQESLLTGLNALTYPSGSQQEFTSGNGSPPVPDYYPSHQIQSLGRSIQTLEERYKDILILRYIYGLDDVAIGKEGICHRNTVRKWISKAKHLLVKSRYWKH